MNCTVSCSFDTEIEINGITYYCEGTAEADYYYQKGCMYMRNGDPGYPDEEELEVTDIDFTATNEDEEEVTDSELLKEIDSELSDWLNDQDYDFWKFPDPYDYEPDYDD